MVRAFGDEPRMLAVADARELRWVKLMSEQDRKYLALVLDVYTYPGPFV